MKNLKNKLAKAVLGVGTLILPLHSCQKDLFNISNEGTGNPNYWDYDKYKDILKTKPDTFVVESQSGMSRFRGKNFANDEPMYIVSDSAYLVLNFNKDCRYSKLPWTVKTLVDTVRKTSHTDTIQHDNNWNNLVRLFLNTNVNQILAGKNYGGFVWKSENFKMAGKGNENKDSIAPNGDKYIAGARELVVAAYTANDGYYDPVKGKTVDILVGPRRWIKDNRNYGFSIIDNRTQFNYTISEGTSTIDAVIHNHKPSIRTKAIEMPFFGTDASSNSDGFYKNTAPNNMMEIMIYKNIKKDSRLKLAEENNSPFTNMASDAIRYQR